MKLFVSYRREDTGGRAGRLCDVLVTRFGAGNVFQDVNAVSPGHDFRVQVEAAIATSDAVLIVIGHGWLGSDGADAGRRIDEENDFVRLEVSLALNSGIPVVPVLVDQATLPLRDELPDDMSEMVGRHAVTIRDASWHQDVNDLISRLKGGRAARLAYASMADRRRGGVADRVRRVRVHDGRSRTSRTTVRECPAGV